MAGEEDAGPGRARANERPAHPAGSERTPLLRPPPDAAAVGEHESPRENGAADTRQRQQQQQQANDDEEDDEDTVIAKETSPTRLALILGTAWLGVFLGAIDSTIIATLSGPIASEFKSLSLLSWLATAYLISNAACQPISGRLTDIFGRGPGLVFSNLFFAAGNLICGLARQERVMVLGRVVAGIGGGGMMSIATFIASDLIPLRNRGFAQGIGNSCYGAGAMLGGILGGLLNDHTQGGWRLAFLIQVPPALISAGAVAVLVKVPPKQSDKSYLARIDFGGVFLTSSFLVLLLLGLNSGGNLVPWTHPLPLTTIPLSLVTLAGFLWWESRVRQPIIPVKLFTRRTLLAACLCLLFATMAIMAALFYVPLHLQVLGDSASSAGLKILPSPLGTALASVGSGYMMKRTGRYVGLGITSLVVFILGIFLFAPAGRDGPPWLTGLAFFLLGGGFSGMLTTTLLACIAAVDHSQQAVVTSATYLARSLGGTIGITVGSAVYQNILMTRLWDRFGDYPNAAEEIGRIRNDLNELKRLPAGWHQGVMESFMDAFRGVWLTMLALAVVALVCIALLRQHTLHTTLERE